MSGYVATTRIRDSIGNQLPEYRARPHYRHSGFADDSVHVPSLAEVTRYVISPVTAIGAAPDLGAGFACDDVAFAFNRRLGAVREGQAAVDADARVHELTDLEEGSCHTNAKRCC